MNTFKDKITNFSEEFLEKFAPLYDKLFYFPGDTADFLPPNVDLSNVEKLQTQNSLGDTIAVWKLHAVKPKGRVIHCHGSGYNISSHFPHVSWLPQFGYEVMMFDYPGYGDSSGKSTRKTTVQTAYDIIQQYSENAPEGLPIFVLGQSLGGNIAAVALTEEPKLSCIHGVILDSMYSSFREQGQVKIHRKYLKRSPLLSRFISRLISDKDAPILRAPKLLIPTLLLHSRNDSSVCYQESLNFYHNMTSTDVEFWSHLNSGHTDVLQNNLAGYQEAVVNWMNSKAR
jgi:alpha-beta hydrolase superfamily lysophospholipase